MSNNSSEREFVKPSDPIAINTSARRSRSVSVSSGSSGSDSTPELQTPASPSPANTHRFSLPSPGSSPILSYFLGQSPTKAPGTATFPFNRKFGPPPVFEDEEEVIPATHQARRASTVVAGRFAQPQSNPLPDPQLERGSNLLRRLSLSSPLVKPQVEPSHRTSRPPPSPPPNTAVSPTPKSLPFARDRKPARSATVNEGPRPRRAPSPMGERILKGHFDGFN
ncbi:hypothetical protein Hypma_006786 [Hypsizygus marmoreus]|uniref:Uncharacterized protein n=1 Tax=Hypsizygus marmoreus TaxID=39966 RepID=A0A369K0K7_HYPMA|nr:hypothetical protein Hypma_006786 [Hypsizygus marmoreus]